jgi:hypothetical protein
MITIDRPQLVEKFEQVLTEANLTSVREGMREQEIRQRFGAPASKVISALVASKSPQNVWKAKAEA